MAKIVKKIALNSIAQPTQEYYMTTSPYYFDVCHKKLATRIAVEKAITECKEICADAESKMFKKIRVILAKDKKTKK